VVHNLNSLFWLRFSSNLQLFHTTNSMEQSTWEANSLKMLSSSRNSLLFKESEGSLPCSQDSLPKPCASFRNKLFLRRGVARPSPNPQFIKFYLYIMIPNQYLLYVS
jgi:hypothetical protein